MNRFIPLLAWRYLWGTRNKKSINVVILISFIGILIGSCALTLTLAIMQGFQKVTHERMQSIHAQITIRAFGNPIHTLALNPVLKNEFPEIASFSPSALQQAFLKNNRTDEISSIVALKGIVPKTETLTNTLEQKLIPTESNPTPRLTTLLEDDHIVIGQKLAQSLELTIGDTITLLYAPDEPRRRKISLSQTELTVAGFFSTGIQEFDMGLIYCTLEQFEELFPEHGITEIHARLQGNANEQATINRLRKRLGIEVYSWKELYPALVSALQLETYVMCIILGLITLIACMNIISLLILHINQKRGDIALFQAMGMPKRQIKLIFALMGLTVCLGASIMGIALALLICLCLQTYPCISLPDAYVVSQIPVHINWPAIAFIFSLTLLLSLLATLLALRQTDNQAITEVLRHQG